MKTPWHHDPRTVMQEFSAIVRFDEQSGQFFWTVNRYGRGGSRMGGVAGFFNENGYRCLRLKGKKFYAHRLAWLFVYGVWPSGLIDHVNGHRSDNRICNIREATTSQNLANTNKTCAESRLRGAHWASDKGKWTSRIMFKGRVRHLGYFTSSDDAHAAYVAARRALHGGFSA